MLLATGLPARFSGTLASLWSAIRAQPQSDVGGLHRPAHDPDEVVAQGVEIRLVSKLGREGLQCLYRVVLPTVETAVDKALDAASQRVEQAAIDRVDATTTNWDSSPVKARKSNWSTTM